MNPNIVVVDTRLESRNETLYLKKCIEKICRENVFQVHYEEFNDELINALKPMRIILAGQGTPFQYYNKEKLQTFYSQIKKVTCPLLGICGGHQLLALCYGGEIAPINKKDYLIQKYEGCEREEGFIPIRKLTINDSILENTEGTFIVYEDHCEEVKRLPAEFRLLCIGEKCKVQMIKHWRKAIYGVQFHPERYTEEYDAGKRILKKFLLI